MLVPLSWLREFVPYEGTAQALGDKLTMRGLELEGIIHPFDNISSIKVGFIAQCSPHPDSDHLHCCKVDVNSGELLDIVCGAPNVAEGQKVAVAETGVRLPDGTLIKKAKLRGQSSYGMICSERELGLSDDHSGIMVLPDSVITGHRLIDALDMERDVLDLSITPNRADCLSIIGVAREVALDFDLPLQITDLPVIFGNDPEARAVPVEIANPELCWLYSGRVISNIGIAPSPMRFRYRLLAAGQRSVSNIVDITNYILLECGQPLHSFDLDKLAGGRIIVRQARKGETITTLDGKTRQLCEDDLCICDVDGPVGIAGVMGGQNTEITSESRNVFLESAVFRPQSIRRTARRLGIPSEAAFRFERGVDQQRTIWSLDRACAMMASMAGGNPMPQFSCVEPRPFIPAQISYRPKRANLLIGESMPYSFQKTALENVGCDVASESEEQWMVSQPSWRPDLTREADLIEEAARIYGLDKIAPVIPCAQRSLEQNPGENSDYGFLSRVKIWGAGIGLNEAVNYSFAAARDMDLLGLPHEPRISVFNPLSEEQDTLRINLAPGLFQDLAHNLAYGVQSIKLFEVARTFSRDTNSETTAREIPYLGIILYGPRSISGWPKIESDLDYSDLKGLVENFAHYLHLGNLRVRLLEKHYFLSPCVEITIKDKVCGYMGCLGEEPARFYNAQKKIWYCELNLEILEKLAAGRVVHYRALPTYPPVRRDITVITTGNLFAEDILNDILAFNSPILESARLVDLYIAGNERNHTFRLTFRHEKRTLRDSDVDREREKIAEYLRKKLGARI